MASPSDRKYTSTHEWIKVDADSAECGYTSFGAGETGTITSVSLPAQGIAVNQNQAIGSLTGSSSSADFHAPVGGSVIDRNEHLLDAPGDINSDPWGTVFCRIKPANMAQFDSLMTAQEYDETFPGT